MEDDRQEQMGEERAGALVTLADGAEETARAGLPEEGPGPAVEMAPPKSTEAENGGQSPGSGDLRQEDLRQDGQLLQDAHSAEAYRELREEVMDLVAFSREHGFEGVDVESAFRTLYSQRLEQYTQRAVQKAQSDAVRLLEEQATASPGALGSGRMEGAPDYETMSEQEFEQHLARAKRGGYKRP